MWEEHKMIGTPMFYLEFNISGQHYIRSRSDVKILNIKYNFKLVLKINDWAHLPRIMVADQGSGIRSLTVQISRAGRPIF